MSSLKNRDRLKSVKNDALRHEVIDLVRKLPNDRLFVYAGISKKDALANPTLGLMKEEAIKEIGRRKMLLQAWEKGKPSPKIEGESVLKKIVHFGKKGAHLLGKGVQEYMKVISGEKARELSDWISTLGMSDEEREQYLKAQSGEADKEERREERVDRGERVRAESLESEEELQGTPLEKEEKSQVERPHYVPEKPSAKTVINIYAESPPRHEIPVRTEEIRMEEKPAVEGGEGDITFENVWELVERDRQELFRDRDRAYDLINEGRRELAEEMEWVQRQKDKIARGEKE